MKRFSAALTVVVMLCWGPAALAQAGKEMSDPNCPAAIPSLKALKAITKPDDTAKISEAALSAVIAYKDCASQALAAGKIEPEAHYAQTRVAQYQVLYGRTLMNLGRYDDAHNVFWEASKTAGLVADWVAPAYGYTNSNKNPEKAAAVNGGSTNAQGTEHNSGVNKSQWRDAASEVRKAADLELVRLVPAPAPTAR